MGWASSEGSEGEQLTHVVEEVADFQDQLAEGRQLLAAEQTWGVGQHSSSHEPLRSRTVPHHRQHASHVTGSPHNPRCLCPPLPGTMPRNLLEPVAIQASAVRTES